MKEREGLASDHYTIALPTDSYDTRIEISCTPGTDAYGFSMEQQYLMLQADKVTPYTRSTIWQQKIDSGVSFGRGANTLSIERNPDNTISILIGERTLKNAGSFAIAPLRISGNDIILSSHGSINIIDLIYASIPDPAEPLHTGLDPDSIRVLIPEGQLTPEGIWKYLDRDTDDRYTRLGGSYRLAIIKSPEGNGYDIIYFDGAKVLSDKWEPGMLKGHLMPTIFNNHYDLIWYDAHMRKMDTELSADMEQGSILSFSFPLLKSTLRFSRIMTDN
ncbi:MAG: hypothetical protein NC043_08520 [Muribaculaceae bacterium]|nr:hypothetical protein [Muribaculaceae bacterium]